MKCPNCGYEMAEGTLYCEHCGEDIHIVPDFEPELEQTMEQTINNVLEELHQDFAEDTAEGDRDDPEEEQEYEEIKPVRKRRLWPRIVLLITILLIAAAGAAAWYIQGYNSEEYQVERAQQYVDQGKYDEAIACFGRALELDRNNIELIFGLADVYLLKNNKVEYEYLLREIVRSEYATAEQLDGAYGKLIGIYRDRGDYQTINDLLLASNNDALLSAYESYIARAPEFSVKEGYYTSIQPLKLTAVGSGKIYYTLDGEEPTQADTEYTAPIILENGDYVVTAYFVNERGIASEFVSKEYHIENEEIPPPEVNAISGEYNFPMYIEIVGDAEEVYYTTDGSDPTYTSNTYTGPIPMPLGKSHFKFARIVEGVTGTVAERNYRLELNTDYTPEEAVDAVKLYCLTIGKIRNMEGDFDESGDSYVYQYLYVTNIQKVDDFYVIVEVYRTADGNMTRTGNNFAVNAYTGELFKLQRDDRGRLSLIEIEGYDIFPEEE
ncbi:MAG: tetratricopeptide repeat protein [Lachnospiraceae bacterium]|jgi:tetratricopeptide (TPR) repeat protein|nr:tetratricopeptide repeat protein [Lachnospiraceae bacterium]